MSELDGALEAIARRKSHGVALDRDEIVRRFRALRGATFADAGVLEAFSDVFDAVCAPPHIGFEPERDRCQLDAQTCQLRFRGLLRSAAGDKIGEIERALDFQLGQAKHHQIVVNRDFRDVGIAAVILDHSLDFYATCGIQIVKLTAALTTGPYYWAKLGFDFDGGDAETTRHWMARVNAKLDLGLDCRATRTPLEWLKVGEDERRTLTLGEVAAAFDDEVRDLLTTRARDCKLELDQPIALGKALLLSVPSWEGRLSVTRAARTRIKVYVAAKGDKAANRLQSPIDGPRTKG